MKHTDKYLRCSACNISGEIVFDFEFPHICKAVCEACDHELSVYGRIPDFAGHVPLADPELMFIQKMNNSKIFAKFYETAVWRAFLTRLGAGISMQRELWEVLDMSGRGPAKVVADLACGTGHYARAFARAFPNSHVYGVDISLSMLQQGVKMAMKKGLQSIRFLRGDVYRLPFNDGCVDRVNCCGALHLFSDLHPIWKEISRILKPGGVFTGWVMIARQQWGEKRLQQHLMNRGKATFFRPDLMADDLNAVGLSSFRYVKHRVWLVFSAMKETSSS